MIRADAIRSPPTYRSSPTIRTMPTGVAVTVAHDAGKPGPQAQQDSHGHHGMRCVKADGLRLMAIRKVVNREGFGGKAVPSPSWPGLSRPSTPHRRSADGRDKPGHDDREKILLRQSL